MTDCLFCRIIAGEIPSRRVFQDATAVAFLDINPFHRGHTLVVPRRHVVDGTTDPGLWTEVGPGIVAVSQLVITRLGATGVNILSNAGAVSGQEIFHFHVHVIPRYADNPGMGAMARREPGAGADPDGVLAELLAA